MKYVLAVTAALVASACSATSQGTRPGDGSGLGGTDTSPLASCQSRCVTTVIDCGYSEGDANYWCTSVCGVATEEVMSCLERAGCSETAANACFGSSSTPDASTKPKTGTGKSGTGTGNPNATEKSRGDSCTCGKKSTATEYYETCGTNLGSLRTDGRGCGTLDLFCISSAKTGDGTCEETCSKDSDCTSGRKCYKSSYKDLAGGYWKTCQ